MGAVRLMGGGGRSWAARPNRSLWPKTAPPHPSRARVTPCRQCLALPSSAVMRLPEGPMTSAEGTIRTDEARGPQNSLKTGAKRHLGPAQRVSKGEIRKTDPSLRSLYDMNARRQEEPQNRCLQQRTH